MFVRSILGSYSRLLAGVALAAMAVALAGCNDKVAEKAVPSRPGSGRHRALRAGIAGTQFRRHHQAPDRDRHGLSGSGQGRKTPGGSRSDRRCRPAPGDARRGRSEIAGRAGRSRIPRRHRRAGAGRRRRNPRQGFTRQRLDHGCAARPEQGRGRRSARPAQPRGTLGRTDQKLAVLCDAGG